MEPSDFRDAAKKALANWDGGEFFVLYGTNPAHKPLFENLRGRVSNRAPAPPVN
jgi:hypothetical protein